MSYEPFTPYYLEWLDMETSPAECVDCGSPTGPDTPIDSEFPGWLCPECYAKYRNDCETCGGDGWVEITKAPFCEHGNRERECCPDCDGKGKRPETKRADAVSPVDGRPAAGVIVPIETIEAIRKCLVSCDSELSAQAHGRPAADKTELTWLSGICRQLETEVAKLRNAL